MRTDTEFFIRTLQRLTHVGNSHFRLSCASFVPIPHAWQRKVRVCVCVARQLNSATHITIMRTFSAVCVSVFFGSVRQRRGHLHRVNATNEYPERSAYIQCYAYAHCVFYAGTLLVDYTGTTTTVRTLHARQVNTANCVVALTLYGMVFFSRSHAEMHELFTIATSENFIPHHNAQNVYSSLHA